jgi:DNA-binding CsgD family transcriptional regulator/tetratricopeptide (TPR) repeat protein
VKLLERERVLSAVADRIEGALGGSGGALFVVGESGLGKTSILERAVEMASGRIPVAFGRGESMEQTVAFGLAQQALGRAGADLLDLGAGAVAEPSVPYHRALRWLEGRSGAPLLIALDDLHWADPDSLRLFGFLARRCGRLPVALVGTLRPWPEEALLLARALSEAGEATLEQLAPLSPTAVGTLIGPRSWGALSDGERRRAFDLTRGNPLLVEQLGRALARGEHLPGPDAGLPALADALLLSRFAGLDQEGLACARAGSVLGTTWRPHLACEIAGLAEPAADRAVTALVRSGLVVDLGGGEVRFAHPLFAQALYDDLPSPTRRQLHTRAARALIARGQDGEAAPHVEQAELHGDAAAIASLERAGRVALATGATETAVRTLRAAARFAGDAASPDLLATLARALAAAGRAAEAAALCERVLAEPGLPWRDRVETLRVRGRALYMAAARDHGEAALTEAARVAAEHEPASGVRPLLDLSLAVWLSDGPGRALPVAARALELTSGADEELRERAEATWGHIALETGDARGLEATERVRARLEGPEAARLLDPTELAWPWAPVYHYAMNCNYADRHEEAERVFRRALEILDRAGAANASATAAIYAANAAIRGGRLPEALEVAQRAIDLADLTPGLLGYAHLVRADALAWLGRLEESDEACARAEALAGEHWFGRLWAAHVRGMGLLWRGDEGASDVLLRTEAITRDVGIREPCHLHWWNHAVQAHLARGREDRARIVLAFAEECAGALRCTWPRIVVAVGRAQIAEHAGDDAAAEAGYRAALELHAGARFPLERVEALLALGSLLRRAGRRADARGPLAEAVRTAEEVGARLLLGLARDELRLAGGRRRSASETRTGLTAAERRVAELAAEGLANAEIARRLHLSVNTVESHLRQVYLKLGVRSRRELMVSWRARGPADRTG